ncbi:MAG: GntR family transcriptional regulator [Solirubrobacteraceae bacterium]
MAVSRPSLVDGAERALRNWLAPGRYRPGDRLPPEYELAEMLGVSRGTLRSALRRLDETGEIVRRQGSGTYVGRLALPAAFDERLEHLEPYSSVAARRGIELHAEDVELGDRPVGEETGAALGLEPSTPAMTIRRILVADGSPVAVMCDIVHPAVKLPPTAELADALARGRMVLDILIEIGVPVTFARTRVLPTLLTSRDRIGRKLQIRGSAAGLELEELVFAGRDERVAFCRDMFAPGGIDVMIMRSLDSPRPEPIAG